MNMYSILFEGKKIELPKYSVALALQIEDLDRVEGTVSDKLKALYDFVESLIGEQITELIGSFDDVDPNMLNILFLQIVNCYNKPLNDYNMKEATKIMDDPNIKKTLDTIDKVVEANKND